MNPILRLFSYLLFWIMLGLLLAGTILVMRGDLQLTFGGGHSSDHTVATGNPSATVSPPHQNSFAEAVAIASPAVVTIRASSVVEAEIPDGVKLLERFLGKNSPHRPKTRTESTSGSGVIMDAEGYILTNHHVIANSSKLAVILNDGRWSKAEVVGTDPETDLAVIKIQMQKLPVITQSRVDELRIGDIVLAIGYPFDVGQTVTQGIISATGRKKISDNPYQNYLQTDAAINPGNSGGALINTDGELVGINSLIYSRTGNFQGISFAIPIDMATHVLDEIRKNGYVQRGWLGVEGTDVTRAMLEKIGMEHTQGVLITAVESDGPASQAEIQNGDIITHIDDKPIRVIADIMQLVADGSPGDVLKIRGLRMRESFAADVTLGQRPLQSQ